jgi:hypothetical protein
MKKVILLLTLLFWGSISFAAVTPNSGIAVQTPNRGIVQFLQGTDVSGTYKTLYTGGTNGSKISGIYMTSNDSTSHLVTCQIVNSTVKYGGVSINTGTTLPGFANAVPAINLMSSTNWPGLPIDAWGNPYLILASGDTLQCTFATNLTSSDLINLVAVGGGDF